jgi:hypothetical protein
MVVRLPSNPNRTGADEAALDLLGHEILAEKAAALGRAGLRVEQAVHAYFIQRELCGLRKHDAAIREYDIPKDVLARLGAR